MERCSIALLFPVSHNFSPQSTEKGEFLRRAMVLLALILMSQPADTAKHAVEYFRNTPEEAMLEGMLQLQQGPEAGGSNED